MAVGIAKKEELLFTRDREDPIALRPNEPGAAADPADPRRGAPLRGDVPPPRAHAARSAVRARRGRRHRAAPPQGAADRVRQPRGRAPRHARRVDARWSARKAPTPCSRISRRSEVKPRRCWPRLRRARDRREHEGTETRRQPGSFADRCPIAGDSASLRSRLRRAGRSSVPPCLRLVPCAPKPRLPMGPPVAPSA